MNPIVFPNMEMEENQRQLGGSLVGAGASVLPLLYPAFEAGSENYSRTNSVPWAIVDGLAVLTVGSALAGWIGGYLGGIAFRNYEKRLPESG